MSEPLLKHQDNFRLRPFQEKDGDSVRQVFLAAMLTGKNSPPYQARKTILTKPWSLYFYVQSIFGAALVLKASDLAVKAGGVILVVSALGVFFAWRRNTQKLFEAFHTAAVSADLANVTKSYSSLGSAFWVAEVVSGKEAGKIVGCVGLDSSTSPEPGTAELRRMAVLPEYQGHGIATRLQNTLISHAREHNFRTITLSTSMFQMAAMSLYERAGFKVVKRVTRTNRFLFIWTSAFFYFYALTL